MGTQRPKRRRRDPYTRTVVRLPERDLSDSILSLAAPLIEDLGPTPAADDVQAAIGLAIDLWNAHVTASEYWGDPRRKPLADLRRKMCGKKAKPGHAETFELLSSRWRKEFSTDPRLVGEWTLEIHDDNQAQLTCETTLPDGVEVEIPPPIEKRVAINGKFLDEVRIRLTPGTPGTISLLSFPLKQHRGEVGDDGTVTVHTKMPTAVAIFAEGLLEPVGGAPVELMVAGNKLSPMVLAEVRCSDNGGHNDIAVLIFKPVKTEGQS